MCVCVCVCACVCVCVCVRAGERKEGFTERESVCVRERVRESVCVREREREGMVGTVIGGRKLNGAGRVRRRQRFPLACPLHHLEGESRA